MLLYVPGFELGGVEKQVGRIACGLDRDRFEPVVAWSDRSGPVEDMLKQAGVPVYHLPLNTQAGHAAAVVRIRELHPDIFHSFSYRKDALDVLAAKAAQAPVIMTTRINFREWDPERRVRDWELERNRFTDRITAVSEAVAAQCVEVEGVTPDQITVIHNGVEIPGGDWTDSTLRRELSLPPDLDLIGYAANYRFAKGHDTLLRAFRRVLGQRPGTHLICCGLDVKGTKTGLQALVRELALDSRVSLLDSRPDVETLYRALDVYIHPSASEGFSNSLLEAMAHALPAVASAVGGTPEAVVDGVTGLLVPPADIERLAGAIITLLSDSRLRTAFGQAGRERATRNFSLAVMLDAYARLYDQYPVL